MADHRERGQSVIGAVAGVAVFLGFLMLAVHVSVGLHTRTVVRAFAHDAARQVASAEVDHDDPAAVAAAQARAEADARRSLGAHAGRVAPFDWSGSDLDTIRLRIQAETPSLIIFSDGEVGSRRLDHRVTVRVERVR